MVRGENMSKTISDETIISALITNGTATAAAKAVGISAKTIYDRMGDSDFLTLYRDVKADILRQSVTNLNGHISAAVQTVVSVMNDKENNAAVRLQAAQTILNTAAKFSKTLTEIETEIYGEKNKFNIDFSSLL